MTSARCTLLRHWPRADTIDRSSVAWQSVGDRVGQRNDMGRAQAYCQCWFCGQTESCHWPQELQDARGRMGERESLTHHRDGL